MPLILCRKKSSGPPAVPTDIAGLRLWVRGDVGTTYTSGGLSGWTNQATGGGIWAAGTQTTAARRATASTLNGIAAPLFAGTDDSINFVPNEALPAFTFQMVSKQTVAAASSLVLLEASDNFSFADRGPQLLQSTTRRDGRQEYSSSANVGIVWNGTEAVVDTFVCTATVGVTPATVRFYRNGVLTQQNTAADGEGNSRVLLQWRLGANRSNAQGFAGILADHAVWNVPLTAGQVLAQAQGAAARWGF